MKVHLFSLSPSCFVNNMTLKFTITILNRLFRHSLILNYQSLLGKSVQEYGAYLDQNRVKDLQLLLLMYDKENRIVDVDIPDEDFYSLCELNKFFRNKDISMLYSKEKVIPLSSSQCSETCLFTKEPGYHDILTYNETYPIPPSQEIRLDKTYDREWINSQIYSPLLTSCSDLKLVDPYIGREFCYLSNIETKNWISDSHWIYGLKELFDIFSAKSLYRTKTYAIFTAVRIDEEQNATATAKEFRKLYLQDSAVTVKFVFYVYERLSSPPDDFPHDRYVLTENIGINVGIGLDTINPDNQQVRRETQLSIVGKKTVSSVISQLKDLPESSRKVLRKKTI
ncbi:MAG: hypothetical protein JSV04_06275 [Candidatus Heimdallarchaeota archaeon]|nr:MAG: hypothetical protein JSV04_06275 [Candidatus Heimdallarchaeota archaeon]